MKAQGESYEETGNGTNNTMETASEVSLDELHKGQIALNENKDYYKFTMEASGSINLHIYHEEITKATATADGKIEQKCECGDIFSTTIIYYPERNDLSEILWHGF